MMPQKARTRLEKRRPTNWTCSWSGLVHLFDALNVLIISKTSKTKTQQQNTSYKISTYTSTMNKKLLVLIAMMLAAASSAATDEDFDATVEEDLFAVGDLEYEDEDEDTSSGDGVRRYLRAYNDRRQGRRRPGRRRPGRMRPGRRPGNGNQRINGQLGTTSHWPSFVNPCGNTGLFTAPQLPYCPNFSMHSAWQLKHRYLA
eukprot:scaffold6352_cov74-Skeletonema_dohrnii-CCMP3373.AAC.2